MKLTLSHHILQAQKYQTLVDDLNQKHLQLSLVQLYHNEKRINVLSETLRERKEVAAEKSRELAAVEQSVKAHKKEHGRLTREEQHMEKDIWCVFLQQLFEQL